MKLEKDFNLSPFNTLGLHAKAELYTSVTNNNDLKEAINLASTKNLGCLFLGEGSNVLMPERITGLVVQLKTSGITVLEEDEHSILVNVAAGTNWHHWLETCLKNQWYGLENLALIPGTVGAAPIQNIGAYGVEVSDFIVSVKTIDFSGNDIILTNADCKFNYRDSVFKHELSKNTAISDIIFRLNKTFSPNLEYPAVIERLKPLEKNITATDLFNTVIDIRSQKLPDPRILNNVGSFFKNAVVEESQLEELSKPFPEIPYYLFQDTSDKKIKIPSAWLIEHCGYKGKRFNHLGMHEKQALVLVNYSPNECSLDEVLNFSNKISTDVFNEFGIKLEIEPQLFQS